MEDKKDGAPQEIVDENNNGARTEIVTEEFSREAVQQMVASAVEKVSKEWQSRFDRLKSEKDQTEKKALTAEEQMLQYIEQAKQKEIQWARKEAKAKAGIDEGLEQAALAFASSDPEQISEAAEAFKAYWDEKESVYKKQIEELEKKLQYGSKAPVGGAVGDKVMSMDDFLKLTGKEQAAFIASGGKPN